MRIGRLHIDPKLTLAMLVVVAGCSRLGIWQLHRAAEKASLTERIERRLAEPLVDLHEPPAPNTDWQYRHVQVSGEFDGSRQLLLDNQILQGRPGYHVVTAFKISGSNAYLLVNRGWTPLGPDRHLQPSAAPPQGTVALRGRFDFPAAKPYGMSVPNDAAWTWRWPFLDLARWRKQTSLDTGPYILLEESGPEDRLIRSWPVTADRGQRHTAYAVQWFAFAIIGLIVYITLALRPPDDSSSTP